MKFNHKNILLIIDNFLRSFKRTKFRNSSIDIFETKEIRFYFFIFNASSINLNELNISGFPSIIATLCSKCALGFPS